MGPYALTAVVKQLESLLGQESVADDYVRLRIEIVRAQATTLDALHGNASAQPCEEPSLDKLRPGVPAVALDLGLARQLFEAIEAACRAWGKVGDAWLGLRSAAQSRPDLMEQLIREAAAAREEADLNPLADRLRMPVVLLSLVGRLMAAPFVTCAVKRQALAPPEAARAGPCPACGAPPGLAMLLPPDGRRRLHCSLCGQAYAAPRIGCPFCAGQDPSTPEQLSLGDSAQARGIEACTQCRRYLKTIDVRHLPEEPEPVALVEEVAGAYLDLIAQREGYRASMPYAALW